jgi:deoxyribose-phosphate aldolase
LLARAATAPGDADAAAKILPLVDLTSLNEADDEAAIDRLCARAMDAGVAAVCVLPRFVARARARLRTDPVQLATVANFPEGGDDIAAAVAEIEAAVAAGADEIDLVAPLDAIMEGDIGLASELVQAGRAAAGTCLLKVILETGRLAEPARITAAARSAVMAGADFLKTSTGKRDPGATLEAAALLLAAIEEADGRVGLKLSGGIRTTAQAAGYLHLVEEIMTPGWVSPKTLRFGASSLLDDLLRLLNPSG